MPKAKAKFWLVKTEPESFSIDDLARKGTEPWNGVRNFTARNFMRDGMKLGELVLFYHSSCKPPGVVGIAKVASEPYPDPTQFDEASQYFDPKSTPQDPRWFLVDVAFVEKVPTMVTLEQLKADPKLEGMVVTRPGRLSVQPVERGHFARVLKMAGAQTKLR